MFSRQHHGVGKHIVHLQHRGRTRIPQVTDLHRRNATREQTGAAVTGMPFQVYSNINPQLAQHVHDPCVVDGTHVDEPVKGQLQTLAHLVLTDRAERHRHSLEPFTIMMLEEPGHQHGGSVLVKVGGQIGNADAPFSPRRETRRSDSIAWGSHPERSFRRKHDAAWPNQTSTGN